MSFWASSWYRPVVIRSDWRYGPLGPSTSGPSSQSSPSQRRSCSTLCSDSRVLRAVSVSSTRMMKSPLCCFAASHAKSAVRAPPTCSEPVGEGAKRVRTRPSAFMRQRTGTRCAERAALVANAIGCAGAVAASRVVTARADASSIVANASAIGERASVSEVAD
eukprot:1716429-Prymnesium_polylepis.1